MSSLISAAQKQGITTIQKMLQLNEICEATFCVIFMAVLLLFNSRQSREKQTNGNAYIYQCFSDYEICL